MKITIAELCVFERKLKSAQNYRQGNVKKRGLYSII